jgi:hypothetical protein
MPEHESQVTTRSTLRPTPPRYQWRWLLLSRDGVSYRGRRLFPSEDKARETYEKARVDKAICFIVENGPVRNVVSLHNGSRSNTGVYKKDVIMFIPIAERAE